MNDVNAGGAARVLAEHAEFGFGFVTGTEEGAEFGFEFGGCGFGGFRGFGFGGVGFAELFEEAEFALESAFGGGFVAQEEVVFFDEVGGPIEGRGAVGGAFLAVKVALGANAVPLGLGGFEDEVI